MPGKPLPNNYFPPSILNFTIIIREVYELKGTSEVRMALLDLECCKAFIRELVVRDKCFCFPPLVILS